MLVTAFNRPARSARRAAALSEVRRIADPAGFLADMAKGAKLAPTLEEATVHAVKVCGPEFGAFLSRRYGKRIDEALATCGEG